jgi:hypothetical protein
VGEALTIHQDKVGNSLKPLAGGEDQGCFPEGQKPGHIREIKLLFSHRRLYYPQLREAEDDYRSFSRPTPPRRGDIRPRDKMWSIKLTPGGNLPRQPTLYLPSLGSCYLPAMQMLCLHTTIIVAHPSADNLAMLRNGQYTISTKIAEKTERLHIVRIKGD